MKEHSPAEVSLSTGRSHDRRNGDGPSYPFPVWNGILEHRARIGAAVWVFLWCLDRITQEVGGRGLVLGGKPVRAEEIADDLAEGVRTVVRHLEKLRVGQYIVTKKTPYGLRIEVTNSRKLRIWTKAERPDKSGGTHLAAPTEMAEPSDKNGGTNPTKVAGTKKTQQLTQQETGKTNLPASPAREARDLAYALFKEHFGQEPSWPKKDYVALADLFKRKGDLTVAEFERRLSFYFDSTEAFVLKQGRSLTYFCSKFDAFMEGPIHNGKRNQRGVNDAEQRDLENLAIAGFRPN